MMFDTRAVITIDTSVIKVERPSLVICQIVRNSGRRLGRVSLKVLDLKRTMLAARRNEMIWLMMVAKAAPSMPQSRAKMKMGSRIVLMIAPDTVETMESLGLPSARMTPFKTPVSMEAVEANRRMVK